MVVGSVGRPLPTVVAKMGHPQCPAGRLSRRRVRADHILFQSGEGNNGGNLRTKRTRRKHKDAEIHPPFPAEIALWYLEGRGVTPVWGRPCSPLSQEHRPGREGPHPGSANTREEHAFILANKFENR